MNSSKNKALVFIIIALLVTNIAVLGYFLWFKKQNRTGDGSGKDLKGMGTALKEEVGFNEQQIAQYRQLKEKQWATVKPMFEDIRKTKDSLFRLLSNENINDSVLNSIGDLIAQKQKALDLQAFAHFKRVRALCTPGQRVKYDSLVQRMIKKTKKPARHNNDSNKTEKK